MGSNKKIPLIVTAIGVLVILVTFPIFAPLLFFGAGPQAEAASVLCAPGGVNSSGEVQIKGKPITAEQKANANIVIGVGKRRGLSRRDVKIGLMVAIQESSLINVAYGDRDSLGLFQQRPSEGWGTPEQVMDPVYASNKFFEALERVEDRGKMSLLEVALAVQKPSREAYESATNRFLDWEGSAERLIGSTQFTTTGNADSTSDCSYGMITGELTDPGNGPQDPITRLVPRAANIKKIIENNWGCGRQPKPCINEIAGYSARASGPQDHTLGLALDITTGMISVYPSSNDVQLGWLIACQLAKNANKIGLQYIIWQGQIWNVGRTREGGSGQCTGMSGWRPYCSSYYGGCGRVLGPTAGHYDHIHVTVQPGVGG